MFNYLTLLIWITSNLKSRGQSGVIGFNWRLVLDYIFLILWALKVLIEGDLLVTVSIHQLFRCKTTKPRNMRRNILGDLIQGWFKFLWLVVARLHLNMERTLTIILVWDLGGLVRRNRPFGEGNMGGLVGGGGLGLVLKGGGSFH